MSPLLIIGIIFLFYGFVWIYFGIKDRDDLHFGTGMFIVIFDIIFVLILCCGTVEVQRSPIQYLQPDSVLINEEYCVAVLNGQSFTTGEAKNIRMAKDGIVKIGKCQKLNSYRGSLGDVFSLNIFSKEEWDKISKGEGK